MNPLTQKIKEYLEFCKKENIKTGYNQKLETTIVSDWWLAKLSSSTIDILDTIERWWAEKREVLAEIEHEQWIAWSKDIAKTENITPARLERWQKLWCPYSELTEAQKDQDREWGDKSLTLVQDFIKQTKKEIN